MLDSLGRDQVSAAVNAVDLDGRTALHYAAYNGHAAFVQALLRTNDIQPDVRDALGYVC